MEPGFIIAPDTPEPGDWAEMLDVRVGKVFDGDGFLGSLWHPDREQWINRVAFRFAFIDAPEMEQPFGAEAKAFLHRLIAGKTLGLTPIGKESSGYLPVDGYRRMLCMGYLTEEILAGEVQFLRNGKCATRVLKRARAVTRNIELEMVINGWAWVTQQYAFECEEKYFAAQDDARDARRGLWALNNPEPPWRFKYKAKRGPIAARSQASLFDRNS